MPPVVRVALADVGELEAGVGPIAERLGLHPGQIGPSEVVRGRVRGRVPANPTPHLRERREHGVRRAVVLGDAARRDRVRRSDTPEVPFVGDQ